MIVAAVFRVLHHRVVTISELLHKQNQRVGQHKKLGTMSNSDQIMSQKIDTTAGNFSRAYSAAADEGLELQRLVELG